MDMSITALDFDGTLRNPVVATAAILCGFFLGGAVILSVQAFRRHLWLEAVLPIVVFGTVATYSRQVTRVVAGIIYGLLGAGWSVGFILGTPTWFSPAVGVLFAIVVGLAWWLRGTAREASNPPRPN